MKLKRHVEGLAIGAICAAVLAKDTLVAITADKTVNKAGAGAVVIGRLIKPGAAINDRGTVETRFKELIEIKASGAIAAGDRVKMAAADGDGNQRVAKWTSQTDLVAGDLPETLFGVCFVGGADGATIQVLTY
jgi:hypothetical protein